MAIQQTAHGELQKKMRADKVAGEMAVPLKYRSILPFEPPDLIFLKVQTQETASIVEISFDRVHESVQKGAVTEEEGNILKVKIFQKVDLMIGIGATVPLGESATLDQKQLLTEMRNTKLLGSGESPEVVTQSGPASPDAPLQR